MEIPTNIFSGQASQAPFQPSEAMSSDLTMLDMKNIMIEVITNLQTVWNEELAASRKELREEIAESDRIITAQIKELGNQMENNCRIIVDKFYSDDAKNKVKRSSIISESKNKSNPDSNDVAGQEVLEIAAGPVSDQEVLENATDSVSDQEVMEVATESESDQSEEYVDSTESGSEEEATKQKVPPIIIKERSCWRTVCQLVQERRLKITEAKFTKTGVRLYPPTAEDFIGLINLFDEKLVSYHSLNLKNKRTKRMRSQDLAQTNYPATAKCAKNHLTENCQKKATTNAICANCGGDHPANYRGCPMWSHERNRFSTTGRRITSSKEDVVVQMISKSLGQMLLTLGDSDITREAKAVFLKEYQDIFAALDFLNAH